MNKQGVRSRIEEVGIIPSIRVSTSEDALFAAEAVARGGIPIIEVTLTVPEAIKVIAHVVKNAPEVTVGAGSVLDAERSYRATQLAYRQALASYLLALEQLREAVGVRALP